MNEWPRVSIVTPSLNQGRYIRTTIESVLSQDYPNLEYWVMDGGSNDNTIEVLRSYGEKVRWISEKDTGQSQAVNKGWMASNGEILGWVNADDILKPHAVSHAVKKFLTKPNIGAIYGNTDYIDEVGKFIQPYPVLSFDYYTLVSNTENYIPQPSVFIRRSILKKTGYLDESLQYLMDYDLWLRLGLMSAMEYIPMDIASLRLHDDAKTVRATAKFAKEFVEIFQKLFMNPFLPLSLRERRIIIFQKVYIHSATFCFWGGESEMALQYLFNAWRQKPFPSGRTFWLLLLFSVFGRAGWKLAELLHGNPMQLKRGLLYR